MDIARRPYSTDARFHANDNTITRIRWYPVAEPVEVLPFPSKVNSLDWSSHPYLATGVGEVFGVSRPYNAATAIDYARGLTPCKPADVFVNGEELDPDAPEQLYDARGLPLCCINHADMEGGIEWGGDFEPPPIPVSGGPDCTSPTLLDAGVWYVFDEVPLTFQFFVWSVPSGNNYRLRMTATGPTGATTRLLFMAGVCPSLLPFGMFPEVLPVDRVALQSGYGGGFVWMRSNGAETPPRTVTVRLDPA